MHDEQDERAKEVAQESAVGGTTSLYVCLYVQFVCMYVRTYVQYICMYVYMYVQYACMYVGFIYYHIIKCWRCMYACAFLYNCGIVFSKLRCVMYVRMYVCMYVCEQVTLAV